MKRLLAAVVAGTPIAASAEVLDKQPSIPFHLLAAAAASLISYTVARRAPGKLATFGLLPILVFLPALSEQLDPIIRSAVLSEGGRQYIFCVWLGPAAIVAAFAAGLYRRGRPAGHPLPPTLLFLATSVAGGLALSTLSGLSPIWACAFVAAAMLINGIIAAIEDRHG